MSAASGVVVTGVGPVLVVMVVGPSGGVLATTGGSVAGTGVSVEGPL